MGKKGKKATLGSIQQAPELPTKTRTLRKNMDNRDGDSPGETHSHPLHLLPLLLQLVGNRPLGIYRILEINVTQIAIKMINKMFCKNLIFVLKGKDVSAK